MARIVKYDPILPKARIFASLKNGIRPKLDNTFEFGGNTWKFHGPSILGVPEQTLLLVLMELAGIQMGTYPTDGQEWNDLRRALYDGLHWEGVTPTTATIQTSHRELCHRCGYTGDGGSARDYIRQLLERLRDVTICCVTPQGTQRCSRLLYWQYGSAAGLRVILNWRLTEAVAAVQYSPVDLTERLTLPSDAARALHCTLCVRIRPGESMRFRLASMVPYIWQEIAIASSTQRRRNQELRVSLESLQALGTWTIKLLPKQSYSSDQIVDIGRAGARRKVGTIHRPHKPAASHSRVLSNPESENLGQITKLADLSDLFK